jgi:hypothetical protein
MSALNRVQTISFAPMNGPVVTLPLWLCRYQQEFGTHPMVLASPAYFGEAPDTEGRASVESRRLSTYHHPEGNSYIERLHRSLKEARASIARRIEEYNYDRASPGSPKSHSARGFLGFRRCTKKRGPDCLN